MEKRVMKWKPTNGYDLRRLEAWYEEMAQEGWHVKEWAYPFAATFDMGLGREMRYRFAQVWANQEAETLTAYRERGWEEVPTALDRIANLRLFRADAEAETLESDEDLLQSGMKERLGKAWVRVLLYVVLMGFLLLRGEDWLGPVHFIVAKLPLVLICFAVWAGLVVRNLSWMRSCGHTIRQRAPEATTKEMSWRSARRKRTLGYSVWLVAVLLTGILWLVQEGIGGKVERADMPEVPYVRLAEMRGEPLYPYYEGSDYSFGMGIGWYRQWIDLSIGEVNGIRRGWSPLGEWYQEKQSDCEVYRDANMTSFMGGEHKMRTKVTFLASEGLAEQFFQEEVKNHGKKGSPPAQVLEGADETVYFGGEGYETQILLVRRGTAVASYVTNDTSVNLPEYLEEMIVRLEKP